MNVVQSKYAYAVHVLNECFLMLFQINYAKIRDGSTVHNKEIIFCKLSFTCSHVFRYFIMFTVDGHLQKFISCSENTKL